MAIVRFNYEDEFIDELKKEFGQLPAPPPFTLVRLTNLFKSIPNLAPIHHLAVVATIKVREDIIRLERYCGDTWAMPEPDEKTYQKAQEIHIKIEKACAELGIEVRAGVWEEG